MSECKHERIRVFYNAETGEAVSLWACTECDYRFVPIAEAESLRAENERLKVLEAAVRALLLEVDELDRDGLGLYAHHASWHPVLDALDAIDAAMKASGSPESP